MLEVKDLTLQRGGREVIKNLSFSLKKGEAVALKGANGAGKSSLLRALAGLLPYEGVINCALSKHYISHLDAVKPTLSVAENLRFWVEFEGEEFSLLKKALEAVNLLHLKTFPASVLSQGQRRRLALSRLVALPKPLWLLDEPYAGLDEASEKFLNTLIITHIQNGGAALIATHHALTFSKRELHL